MHSAFLLTSLVQGLCEAKQLEDFDKVRYGLAIISRRSRLHAGPRYKARGLNEYYEPGNELEVEQVCDGHVDPSNLYDGGTYRRM